MEVTLWGTRGSVASPGPETVRYGGNTACVEVMGDAGTALALDAGTGIRRLGDALSTSDCRIDVLLTHLHMDHIQGLGFFGPLYQPGREIHIWGPCSATMDLQDRLARYLSPPLFPVRLRELPCKLTLHDVPLGEFEVGEFTINTALISHPGPTVGYRISDGRATIAYMPDHEPALGWPQFPGPPQWMSGYELARGADLLIHDTQYTDEEYDERAGWGHSSFNHALKFAKAAGVRKLMTFHHDPWHSDDQLDDLMDDARRRYRAFEIIPGMEGVGVELAARVSAAGEER